MLGKRALKASKEFLGKARAVHGHKYDYSLVNYIRARDKVIIICPIHGEFTKTPNKHLMGQGCPQCSNLELSTSKTKSYREFLQEASRLHSNKYSYIEETYKNAKTHMTIICEHHGEFQQTPDGHINKGSGCPKCASILLGDAKRKTTEEFVKEAAVVHDNKYSYEKTNYYRNNVPVIITCPHHGHFEQYPGNHLAGKGCIKCMPGGGFDKSKPGILYYLSIDDGKYFKIGITNKTVWDRFSKGEHQRISILKQWEYPIGIDAYTKEQQILEMYKDSIVPSGTKVLRDGNTEIFIGDVLELSNSTTKEQS